MLIAQTQPSPRIEIANPIDPEIWNAVERIGLPSVILLAIASVVISTWKNNAIEERRQRVLEAEIDRRERAEDRKNLQDITNAAIARAHNSQQILFDDLDIAIKACTEMAAIAKRIEERCDRIERILGNK